MATSSTTVTTTTTSLCLAYEKENMTTLYGQLLLAGYHSPRLEELIVNLFFERYDPSIVANIREIICSDEQFLRELAGVAAALRLLELGIWLVHIKPADFQVLANIFIGAGMNNAIPEMVVACNFEGYNELGFRLEEAQSQEAKLKADPALLDKAFLLSAALDMPTIYLYLLTLGPSKMARLETLGVVCNMMIPSRGQLFKLLYQDIDQAAMVSLELKNLAAAIDLYYFVKEKTKFLEAVVVLRQWQVAQSLIAMELLQRETFKTLVAKVKPDAMEEMLTVVNETEFEPIFNVLTQRKQKAHISTIHQSPARKIEMSFAPPPKPTLSEFVPRCVSLGGGVLKRHMVKLSSETINSSETVPQQAPTSATSSVSDFPALPALHTVHVKRIPSKNNPEKPVH